jgi:GGDEF domain-containing protein
MAAGALESQASTIRDEKGEVAKLVIVNRDISERKRAEQLLEHNQFHDALTGLPNRRLFLERLQQLFARARRTPDQPYALLLANVDHFKVFNDTLGPAAGDHILAEISRRIASYPRQDDALARSDSPDPAGEPVLSRLGGDEFTVLLDHVSDPSDAMRVGKRLQAAVAEPFFWIRGRFGQR